ncbi:MAG: transposase [Myxococcales bacterium]|nr:MAG: transposase [Myxococcales bacterium]
MARMARVVIPGWPHHVTQRGNRRQQTFFDDSDYRYYIALMTEWGPKLGVEFWAYTLMPNHVHHVAIPHEEGALAACIGEIHPRYSRHINFREGWRGYLWQGRFFSTPMDESYLLAATRYIELNPVRARLVTRPEDWLYSSALAHLGLREDRAITMQPLCSMVNDWNELLRSDKHDLQRNENIRRATRTGRPLAPVARIEQWERQLGRRLQPQKPGRKPKRSPKK